MNIQTNANDEEAEYLHYNVIRLQAIVRTFLIRSKLIKDISARYEKIYDPKRRRFYYYDKVKDKSSWVKPALLLNRELPVAATYTPEQAAFKIQRVARRMLALLKVRLQYQGAVMKVTDENSNDAYYYNPKTGASMWRLPSFMNDRLDYVRKDAVTIQPTSAVEESDDDDDSDASSLDSEAIRAKRRRRRKFPRSKAQQLVDYAEDNHLTALDLDLSHLNARHVTSRIYDLTRLQTLNLSHNKLKKISTDIQYLSK